MTQIYILRLEGGYYYVGKSNNPMRRYEEHVSGTGTAWTRAHRPISIEKVIPDASPFDEDRYVKEYMNTYGIDKVRGGAYVQEVLSEFQKEAIQVELWAANDKCTTCGREGHFAVTCNATVDVNGDEIYEDESSESSSETGVQVCYRCGRQGHYASNCYAYYSY